MKVYTLKSYEDIYAILDTAQHQDHIDIVNEEGELVGAYRLEQVWGTNSLAVLFRKGEHAARFNHWMRSLKDGNDD